MKQAKRNLRIRILVGMLAVWLLFWGYSSLWTISRTRDEQLNLVSWLMAAAATNTASEFLSYLDEKPDHTDFSVPLDNDVRSRITSNLNGIKSTSNLELELACYDQNNALFAHTDSTITLRYTMPSLTNQVFPKDHYGMVDLYSAFPEDVADRLIEYLTYNEEWSLDDWTPGTLVGYGVSFGPGWTDGQHLIPVSFAVFPLIVEVEGELGYKSPQFDAEGNITDSGTVDILWHYINSVPEAIRQEMVPCSITHFSVHHILDSLNPKAFALVTDQTRFMQLQTEGISKLDGYIQNTMTANQIVANGLFTTEFYSEQRDSTLYDTTNFVRLYSDVTDIHSHFTIVAAGTLYPLRDSLPTIAATGLISLLLLTVMGSILFHALGKVLYAQMEAEQRRRNLTNAIAHDLKSPLAAVLGYAENLLEHTRPDKQEHYLRSIHTQTRKMNDILGKMLEISIEESLDNSLSLTEFPLGELCREAAEDCFLAESMYLISGDANITADRELLRRCMDNFLSNAKRHISPGGLVAITIRDGVCEVYNPGSPIPEDALPHIWEPYYQSDNARGKGGSGLGLSIVREIMNRHGFSHEAENREDGVAFRFRFQPEKTKKKGEKKMVTNKKRISIIAIGIVLFLLLAVLILWEVYIPRPGIVLG